MNGSHRDATERLSTALPAGTPVFAHRAYTGIWAILVKWFRVPEHPPTLPTAPGEHAVSFRPSEAYLRYLKFLFWIGLLLVDVVLTGLWIVATVALLASGLWPIAILIAPIAIAIIVLPDIVAYVGIHLRYDTTWYVLTSRSLRARHGVWVIRELTLTFENVQNVRIVQGPLQRYYGIASVLVETAGGGSGAGGKGEHAGIGHHASIDGITNAEEVRDLILSHMRASRTAGLGDDREHPGERLHDRRVEARAGAPTHLGGAGLALTSPRQLELLRAIRDELRAVATRGS